MSLDKSKLSESLRIFFGEGARDYAEAAQKWTDAYAGYAEDAEAFGCNPTIPESAKDTMKSSLEAYFKNVAGGTAVQAATVIGTAVTVFWLSPPIEFSETPPIEVLPGTPPLTPALIASLTAIFLVAGGTHASKAAEIADALDTFTKTVYAINTITSVTTTLT